MALGLSGIVERIYWRVGVFTGLFQAQEMALASHPAFFADRVHTNHH
ncbi:hypothetical protein CRENPOLYSF1_1320005 [Crenothrix polyspora]|uniref:Uncharacterized protein n=1 Tax=Crenothrix polyspora TaxID=360316 RepID=A0A1R4H1A1_9GAMM|nr:hypothetical protein CRENPOLYSF1_1320005 [Crenothrix polyspora]